MNAFDQAMSRAMIELHRVRAMIEMHRVRVFLAFSGRLGVCVCVCVLSCRLCVLLCLVALGAVAPVPLEALRGFVSRGGDGRHHDVASRCGITMRHHDAHVVERVGFFSRRAVKELTVSDGATALPTPRTCTGRLYYFII